MYKTYYHPDKAFNFFPRNHGTDSIRVISIGHSHPWPGYKTAVMNRNCYVWHFLKSGKILYRGHIAQGPCSFLMLPGKDQFYEVTADSPLADQYWIIFSSPFAEDLLKTAGIPNQNDIFPCPYIDQVWELFEELTAPEKTVDKDGALLLIGALFRLLSLHAHCVQSKQQKKKTYSPYVRTLLDYIKKNYALPLTESILASEVNLSVNYMHRCFSNEVGIPPIQYLNKVRMRCAKRLLSDSNYSMAQIAESVGFSNGNYFCRVFQKYNNGLSPTEYRKLSKSKNGQIIKPKAQNAESPDKP